ncbi:M14 family zinc carboxypeptidase [Natronospira bacteriovora]|uniref:M14 family zinc carboxypeptidase n=1 Tax=Natronospira bacteriovora TaxID=3069753 RepID=A0ABU0W6N2_9GAMM|nr:M14 family zinc carboxypeptidase [Natronospira sp. AB-CW4]MDQ2069686.1 M14 family zinc carboxypeptidase [Natronospira sp. AB-CW4]
MLQSVRTTVLALGIMALMSPLKAEELSYEAVIGYSLGERIATSYDARRYMETLAGESDRISLVHQGESYERRPLIAAIITHPDNHARLDEIRETAQRLGDPRRGEARIENQPAVLWLGGSIHGFELSGTDGLLKLMEELVTSDSDEVSEWLMNTVVIIDPTLNPDGRDAFAMFNHRRIGRAPNPSQKDWSNDFTGWDALGFRTSHYFFDINRDWFAHTHPETRARMPLIQAWRPQVVVDAHEMGHDTEFYFDPPTQPRNPFFPDFAWDWFEDFGAAYADAFDAEGIEYTKRDIFNYFYPAYTTSWGSYQGAVGMLYEQGSTRGLALELSDGSVRTLEQALHQQYVAARAAVALSSRERERLLRDYHSAHEAAIHDGRSGTRRYILTPEGDPGILAETVAMLLRNGIEVHRLEESVRLRGLSDRLGERVGSREIPAGSFVIEAAQPRNRLIRALLEPETPVPEDFLAQARERIDRGENPRFYDITAWSLPLLFDLPAYASSSGASLPLVPQEARPVMGVELPDAAYAWLIDGRQTAAVAAAFQLRNQGYRVSVSPRAFEAGGESLASGTIIVRRGGQKEGLETALAGLVKDYDLRVVPVDGGRTTGGDLPALGGADTFALAAGRIGLLAEHPMHAYSFGWAWHTLDQTYGLDTTVLRLESLGGTRLESFSTLILSDTFNASALAERIGEEGMERLKRWVRDGGNLVVIGNSVDFAREHLELISLEDDWAHEEGEAPAHRISVPGAFFATEMDARHWLAGGYTAAPKVLVNSSRIFRAPDQPPSTGRNAVLRYAQGPVAGHAWEESIERLPGGVFAWEERAGSGRVIAFPEDINFRGYWRGVDRLFLNAVVLGPSA